ncbi:MAG: S41 family peptidase [Bacteroidetes bacterium]|nr:S41 family peptidase [Bacteroidota bacterium]
MLVNKLERVFKLGIKTDTSGKYLIIYFHEKKFKLSNDGKNKLNEFCDYLKPIVLNIFNKSDQTAELNYDFYLSNMLAADIDSKIFDNKVYKFYEERRDSCQDFKINKNNDFVISENGLDNKGNLALAETKIIGVNNIPIDYFTVEALRKFLFDNNNHNPQFNLIDNNEIGFNTCHLKIKKEKEEGFRIDKNGICYIKYVPNSGWPFSYNLHDRLSTNCLNIKKIIIDLRHSSFGSIREAIDIANFFLPQGLPLAELIGKNQDTTKYVSLNYNLCENTPIFLFIDEASSGAEEILARILQEYKRATIIGEKTDSNEKIHRAFELMNDYYVNIYIGNLLIVNKYKLGEDFVVPDIYSDQPDPEKFIK